VFHDSDFGFNVRRI